MVLILIFDVCYGWIDGMMVLFWKFVYIGFVWDVILIFVILLFIFVMVKVLLIVYGEKVIFWLCMVILFDIVLL